MITFDGKCRRYQGCPVTRHAARCGDFFYFSAIAAIDLQRAPVRTEVTTAALWLPVRSEEFQLDRGARNGTTEWTTDSLRHKLEGWGR
jgi:hypothetical protein